MGITGGYTRAEDIMANEIQRRTLMGAAGLFITGAAAQEPAEARKLLM